jgi:hypothetical protein
MKGKATCFSHRAMLTVYMLRKVCMTEMDRVCTTRHDAELDDKDGEVNMHRQHPVWSSRLHAESGGGERSAEMCVR